MKEGEGSNHFYDHLQGNRDAEKNKQAEATSFQKDWNAGMSIDDLVEKYNLSAQGIHTRVHRSRKRGEDFQSRKKRKYPDVEKRIENIQALIKQGKSIMEIANIYGVSPSTIYRDTYILKAQNIPIELPSNQPNSTSPMDGEKMQSLRVLFEHHAKIKKNLYE